MPERVGEDEVADEARALGAEYGGRDVRGRARKVGAAGLRERFREMAESDEDA